MRLLPLLLLGACSAGPTADDTDDTDAFVFEPAALDGDDVDPATDRLCAEAADPGNAPDTTFLDCRLEGGSFALPDAPVPDTLQVVVWNLERGFGLDGQIAGMLDGSLPRPDVLLVSEVDRGCARTQHRHVVRELAEALDMAWVYGVEFVELPGDPADLDALCEHGNAVLARWPLGNPTHRFHRSNDSWYAPPDTWATTDEPRLGGRSLVGADVQLGDVYLRLLSLHFESRVQVIDIQVDQAVETGELAAASPIPVLVGGDTNSPGYTFDVEDGDAARGDPDDRTIAGLLAGGLTDAHAALGYPTRATRKGLVLDLLLGRDVTLSDPGVCAEEGCGGLSDHQAVWATVALR